MRGVAAHSAHIHHTLSMLLLLLTWNGASWKTKCTLDLSPLRMLPMRALKTCTAAQWQGNYAIICVCIWVCVCTWDSHTV
jgi:hypothetical protein